MSDALRSPLLAFALEMEGKLAKHDHDRGVCGWRDADPQELLQHCQQETDELQRALDLFGFKLEQARDHGTHVSEAEYMLLLQEIVSEAADVANMAMMVADSVLHGARPAALSHVPAEPEKPPETVLDEAARIVDGPRRVAYGDPRVNHGRTAAMWGAYLGIAISPRQVCMLNILQKCSRDANLPKRDNIVDIPGWARNAEIVSEPPETTK